MTREEMIEMRKRVMLGTPPYTIDEVMGTKRRLSGTRGLHELKDIGDFSPNASGVILALETHLQLIDHLLEINKEDEDGDA